MDKFMAKSKFGICKLCLQQKKLCRSHILPEFLYKSLYDENHKYHVISNIPEKKNFKRQIGLWEFLLCKECEAILQKYEDYVYRLLNVHQIQGEKYRNAFVINNCDYHKLKLFQLSLLWRIGISERKEFYKIKIPEKHNNILRHLLLSDNPGNYYDYGCRCVQFMQMEY
jgi:hypothetical protein